MKLTLQMNDVFKVAENKGENKYVLAGGGKLNLLAKLP